MDRSKPSESAFADIRYDVTGASMPGNNLNPFLSAAAAFTLALACMPVRAQQLEPRAYANLPIGLNFLLAGYAYSQGDVLADPSLPVSDPKSKWNTLILGIGRRLNFWESPGAWGWCCPTPNSRLRDNS